MAKKKEESKKPVTKKTSKKTKAEQKPAVVEEATKAIEGEVVQAQPVQPQVKQGNGKWCCCCAIIFVIFILIWILVQVLSFSGMMPLPFLF
ncbi:MAG: hypothetical protein Q7S53_04660 [bacterium]|nr:hypothetical protein [bacterium]